MILGFDLENNPIITLQYSKLPLFSIFSFCYIPEIMLCNLSSLLNDLPWMFSGIIVIFLFVTIGLSALFISRRLVEPDVLRKSHDIAGFTFGIVGMIYAVLLGFTVVEVNDRFQEAERHILNETTILTELYRDASAFLQEEKTKLRGLIKAYAIAVHDDEWEQMAKKATSEPAKRAYNKLWQAYADLNPTTDKERIWYAASIERMNKLSTERIDRFYNSKQSLGPLMWTLLFGGAFINIFFMCFFAVESFTIQATMTAFLAGTIAFMLFLIMTLEGIYSGNVHVCGTELKAAVEHFDEVN